MAFWLCPDNFSFYLALLHIKAELEERIFLLATYLVLQKELLSRIKLACLVYVRLVDWKN